jgi:hypothetical protein
VALTSAAVLQDASAQEGTLTPGQPTQARVLIDNRERNEAVPVSLETIAADVTPLPVEVRAVTVGPANVLTTRATRQQWEYRLVGIPTGGDPTAALNAAGMDAWETTGLMVTVAQGTVVVMKRPR